MHLRIPSESDWFFLIVGMVSVVYAIRGVRRGTIMDAGGPSDDKRSESPGFFWFSVVFYWAMGILGVVAFIVSVFWRGSL